MAPTAAVSLSNVKSDEITGSYDNGVLKLTLPKKNPTQAPTSRRVDIQ